MAGGWGREASFPGAAGGNGTKWQDLGYPRDLEEARFPGGHLRGAGRSALGGWFWTRGRVPQLLGSRGWGSCWEVVRRGLEGLGEETGDKTCAWGHGFPGVVYVQ